MKEVSKGSALLVSLWATATLAALGIAQATRVSLELKWAGRMQESRQAGHLAWAGLELASDRLRRDPERGWDALHPDDVWGQVPQEPVPFPPGSFLYQISDEWARIPLNAGWANADLLAGLPGFTVQAAAELVAWRAEGKQITHLGELSRFTGFNIDQMEKLEPLATVHGGADGAVNINTASPEVLIHLGISSDLASRIAEFRQGGDGTWGTPDDGVFPKARADVIFEALEPPPLSTEDREVILRLVGTDKGLKVNSSFFRVELEGRTDRHGIVRKARAVLERGEGQDLKIRQWHEFR